MVVRNQLGASLLGLGFVNVFHQHTLVLEHITLGLHVQAVVEMFVNLARFTVFTQQTAQNTLSSHPNHRRRHARISGTTSLTRAHVATFALGFVLHSHTRSRVNDLGFAKDQTVLDQLSYGLTRIGISNLGGFIGIQPNLALTTAKHTGSQALLQT